jgi:4-amino-4-deoxy-L-arabinose transferase-like glycosyltransferase
VFLVTTPMLVTAFKEYMLDAPLTAMVALTLYLLVAADRFGSTPLSIGLGAVCGLGLLTKWSFPLAVWLPIIVTAVAAVRAAGAERKVRRIVNLLLAAVVTDLIAWPWYGHNLNVLRRQFHTAADAYAVANHLPHVWSAYSLSWYFWNLVGNQLYLVPFLFFAAGVAFAFLKHQQARRNLVPFLTIVGTYIGFTLLRDKAARFTDVLLPAVAIVATSWLELVGHRARAWLAGTIAVYGAVAFFAISFGTGLLPKNVTVEAASVGLGGVPLLSQGFVTVFAQHGYIIGPPTNENWHQEDLFTAIAAAVPPSGRTYDYEGPDSIWFNPFGAAYYAARYDVQPAQPDVADFLIVGGSPAAPAGFRAFRRYALPDGETVILYRRRT